MPGVSAVKINGTVVYSSTEPDPLDAHISKAQPSSQKSPEYTFHKSVGFLNRTVNGQPLSMAQELEQAMHLNDPISADQIRQAAAAASKKPPSYDQLLNLRKHFAKEIQQTLVEEARQGGTSFEAVDRPLLPALEHPSFDAYSIAATVKHLGKGAKYSAGPAAMRNMDNFLKQFFKYTEIVRQIQTVKVSEIQKGLDRTREALGILATSASLTREQQQLLLRVNGEIEHQQAEVNVVASLADGVRLIVPQIAVRGITLANGSLDSNTIMEDVSSQMATLINQGDAQRARTATQLSYDMSEKPSKRDLSRKGNMKGKSQLSNGSAETAGSGATASQTSPNKTMPPPSPRTPTNTKRKGETPNQNQAKRPNTNSPKSTEKRVGLPTTPKFITSPQTPSPGGSTNNSQRARQRNRQAPEATSTPKHDSSPTVRTAKKGDQVKSNQKRGSNNRGKRGAKASQ